MVRCADQSLYTGVTTDVAARVAKHNSGRGARYTRSRLPVHLVYREAVSGRSAAGERLAEVLAKIEVAEMSVPVITNVEAAPNKDAERIRDLLVQQVSAPVRWQESIAKMVELGVDRYIEVGPGKVLSGLVKRMAKGSTTQNVQDVVGIKALAE